MSLIDADVAGRHPDLGDEQRHVDRAYACLAEMRRRAEEVERAGYAGGNVHSDTGLTPEDAARWRAAARRRVEALSDSGGALCFGRVDTATGERHHVGRRHVEDAAGDPVVLDWRASAAAPFYRATVADPLGLTRRRRLLVEGRQVVDLLDEDMLDPSTGHAGAYVPDPLLAEIQRARTGEMRDIVATIQAEQDAIIRAPLGTCIVVQGGPGTGKTAVGLHRAAYLLYEHRERLEREGLLVLGPNAIFLRYIAQVLPSLGEVAAVHRTIEGLAGGLGRVRAQEPAEVARTKGDARMAEVVRRAVFDQVRVPADDVRVSTRFGTITLQEAEIADLVEAALADRRPHASSRAALRQQLVGLARRSFARRPTTDLTQVDALAADLRSNRDLKVLLDACWPATTAAVAVRRLLGHGPTRSRCAAGVLSAAEADALARRPARRAADEPWTRADLALLDEAQALVGGVATTYGHIVVDEAQDLSAMELRMVARRMRSSSLTVLGDLAQATAPAAQRSWEEAIGHLGVTGAHLAELTVGYRVPGPIMALADRLLAEAAPGLRPTVSVREDGEPPTVVAVSGAALADAVAAQTASLVEAFGLVGVVVPSSLADGVVAALSAAGVPTTDARRSPALGDGATVLVPPAAKGLELDGAVLVEPARIVAEEPGGARALYIALTRAVQRLTIVHSEDLPPALAVA